MLGFARPAGTGDRLVLFEPHPAEPCNFSPTTFGDITAATTPPHFR